MGIEFEANACVISFTQYISEYEHISTYTEKFGEYFRKKGWFGFSAESVSETDPNAQQATQWNVSSSSSRILVEIATAYAITKALLPVRIMFSLWATPGFARVLAGVGRVARRFGRGVQKGKTGLKGGKSVAAGTGVIIHGPKKMQ